MVPDGFYEKRCEEFDSDTFTRGRLFPKAYVDEQEALGRNLFFETGYPRWTLYGGPFHDVDQMARMRRESDVGLWANRNGYVWYTDFSACIVPDHNLAWPYREPRWQWVWEPAKPALVEQRFNRQTRQVEWVWEGGPLSGIAA